MTISLANFNQDAYPATDEFQCIQVYLPAGDEYKWVLAGLMNIASRESSYLDPESAQAEGVAQLWRDAYLMTDWSGCMPPSEAGAQTRVTFFSRFDENLSIGARTYVPDLNQPFGHYMTTTTPSIGDEVGQRVWLPAGDYEANLLYVRLTTGCKLDLIAQYEPDLSQVVIMNNFDMSGATLRNQIHSANFTLTQAGNYLFSWKAAAAGDTAAGFQMAITATDIYKVTD